MKKQVIKIKKDNRLTFVMTCGECPYLEWKLLKKSYPKKSYKCSKLKKKVDPLVMSEDCPFESVGVEK